ncbi:MAG: GNAT family N-acetyltransferase [Acidimicrobiales bacterium]
MVIRLARPEDVRALGEVHVRTWQAAYAGHFPQTFLDALDPCERWETWRNILERADPGRRSTFVVEIEGELCGFASIGPSRDDDLDDFGELYGLYLLPDRWRLGIGRQLMEVAVRQLVQFGFRQAMLWVFDKNERARQFYEAEGWLVDGTMKVDDSRGIEIPEVRYRRVLGPR